MESSPMAILDLELSPRERVSNRLGEAGHMAILELITSNATHTSFPDKVAGWQYWLVIIFQALSRYRGHLRTEVCVERVERSLVFCVRIEPLPS
jgi:hypothetical protein